MICFSLAIADFLSVIKHESAFAKALHQKAALVEVYELLGEELTRRADGKTDLVRLSRTAWEAAIVLTLPAAKDMRSPLYKQGCFIPQGTRVCQYH